MSGYIDRDKLLSQITKDHIIQIITDLGSGYKEDSQGNICCSTALCHGGDSPYKLVYYFNKDKDEGRDGCHCFTCGASFDLVELVIRALRIQGYSMTYYKALRWIAEKTGITDVSGDTTLKKRTVDFSWISRLKKIKDHVDENIGSTEINENILDIFANICWEPWTHEYISYQAQTRFEIGYYGLNHSITIPHRDMDGRLIGIRQRYLDKDDIERIGKYTPVQIEGKFLSHRLGNELYGLWVCKNKIKETHRIILVEAEKSVLQGYTFYGQDSVIVACCGSSITIAQQKIIMDLGVNEVNYAPDRDYKESDSFEAEAWYQGQLKKLQNLVQYCTVYLIADRDHRLGLKQSPTDNGKEVFEQLFEERIQITREELSKFK